MEVAGTCSMFCVSTQGIIPELSKKGAGLIFNSGTLPDTYFYWGYIRTGGLALRWFKDSVCGQEKDGDYFDVLNNAAKDIPAGSDGVLFLPYLTGGTNDVKEATGCFLNMTLDTDQATLWHAVLEAIGYDYMEITDLYRGAGVDMSRITITEGGSRSEIWNQMKSDMLGSEVITLKNAGGAVVTDCIVGAYALGHITDMKAALTESLEIKKLYYTNAENHDFYAKQYALQKKLVKQDMKEAFHTLKALH